MLLRRLLPHSVRLHRSGASLRGWTMTSSSSSSSVVASTRVQQLLLQICPSSATSATSSFSSTASPSSSITPSSSSSSSQHYNQLLQTLLTLNSDRRIRLGVDTTRSLLKSLGPKYDIDTIPCIHVAGSNGKGSVATKMAKLLQLHGLRVGLYTSPHVSSFRERFQCDDELITEEEVCTLVPKILEHAERDSIPATFFELGTALAFGFFKQRKVDVAVLEVGLGGRLDSTNVIRAPELTFVTSISLEHTQWLGNTIEEITREKAGIMKKDAPCVIGPNVRLDIIKQTGAEKQSGEIVQSTKHHDYDMENNEIVRTALPLLLKRPRIASLLSAHSHSDFDPRFVERALKTRPPCRFQRVQYDTTTKTSQYLDDSVDTQWNPNQPTRRDVVLDVCHNPDAFRRLFGKLLGSYAVFGPGIPYSPLEWNEFHGNHPDSYIIKSRKVTAIAGFSSDKDTEACLSVMMDYCTQIYVVSADTPRAAKVEDVLRVAKESLKLRNSSASCKVDSISPSPYTTLHQLLTTPDDRPPILLCCGTFFIMSDVRRALNLPHPVDALQVNEQSMKKG